jgi:aryl-alcohol dehydrogenase-like predicted oxidoreductase
VPRIPGTDLDVFGLCLGGNVFGWTADQSQSFAVLDSYVDAGGNFIDSADSYAAFAPGLVGGESETVLGSWLSARHNRERIVLATKVGRHPSLLGLAPSTIHAALEASLRRLQTDYVDLYYAHADDPETPLDETLETFDELIRAGKVRWIAASNYTAPRLAEALAISDRRGLARYAALQPHYSLVARSGYEGALQALCVAEDLACVPYWGLERGFLTGKYRTGGPQVDSPRAAQASKHLDNRGRAILSALDEISSARVTPIAAVALAWLRSRPAVVAPVASARTPAQLAELLPAAELELSPSEVEQLDAAGDPG